MVKHLGSKKTKYRTERNAIRTKPVFAEFYLFFLLLFCFRPGYILLFAHFIDRTFVAFFGEWTFHINIILSQHLETRRLRTKSLSTRYSLLGSTQYSVSTHTHSEMRTEPNNRTDRATNSKWIAAPRKSGFSPTVSLFLDRSRGGERHSWWAQSPLANFFGDLKWYKKGGKSF